MSGKVVRTVYPLKEGYPFFDIYVGQIYKLEDAHKLCSFDLINKSLLIHGLRFSAITTYQATQPWRTALFLGIGIVLLFPVLFYRKSAKIS